MYVLGIDCATAACSAAVIQDGTTLSHRFVAMMRGHASALVPMIEETLLDAGHKIADIDLIAVTVGPGAFTGVRIGLATAHALTTSTGIPMIGITTMEAVARAQGTQEGPLLVAMETKRADIYVQLFLPDGAVAAPPLAVEEADLTARLPEVPLVVAGDAAARAMAVLNAAGREAVLSEGPEHPDAAWVAMIGSERYAEATLVPAEPLYLRPPDVGPPKKRN